MRGVMVLAAVAALIILALYRCGSREDRGVERAIPGDSAVAVQQRAHQNRVTTDHKQRPELAPVIGTLEIRRPEPPDPGARNPPHHEHAVRFVETMERFRRESGISEERMPRVLLVLYDYQEVHRYRYPRSIRNPEWALETDQHVRDLIHESRTALREIMTPEEYAAWEDFVRPSALVILMIRHDLIAPQEKRTGSEP